MWVAAGTEIRADRKRMTPVTIGCDQLQSVGTVVDARHRSTLQFSKFFWIVRSIFGIWRHRL